MPPRCRSGVHPRLAQRGRGRLATAGSGDILGGEWDRAAIFEAGSRCCNRNRRFARDGPGDARIVAERRRQPGLRRRREQRRDSEERLHRALQQRVVTGRPEQLVGAIRGDHRHELATNESDRRDSTRRLLPRAGVAGRRRNRQPAVTRRDRHDRDVGDGGQGGAGRESDDNRGRNVVPVRRGRPARLRDGDELLRGQPDAEPDQHDRGAAGSVELRRVRHRQQRRGLHGRLAQPA